MSRTVKPPQDAVAYIKSLEKRIENLERSQRIGNTAVDDGSVVVNGGAIVAKHPNGQELFRSGAGTTVLPFEVDPTEGYLTRIRRASGVTVFESFASDDGAEAKMQINDRLGNEILGDDWLSGKGLSRPFISLRTYTIAEYNNPTITTTSATYVGLYQAYGVLQHNGAYARIKIVAGIGTTGNIRLQDTFFNYTIASAAITSGFNGELDLIGNLNGLINYGDNFNFEIQVQRTAGAGTIGILPLMVYGRAGI